MWIVVWLACSQETSVDALPNVEQASLVEPKVPVENPSEEPLPLSEGTVFFAKDPKCDADCIVSVKRQVPEWTPQIALDSLYKGPSSDESGYRFLACGSTGAILKGVEHGVAKVQLLGGCGGCGTTSVFDLILPTLKSFPEINVVHLYDANGKSQIEGPTSDSRPACLEP